MSSVETSTIHHSWKRATAGVAIAVCGAAIGTMLTLWLTQVLYDPEIELWSARSYVLCGLLPPVIFLTMWIGNNFRKDTYLVFGEKFPNYVPVPIPVGMMNANEVLWNHAPSHTSFMLLTIMTMTTAWLIGWYLARLLDRYVWIQRTSLPPRSD